ncbi:MAG: tetratricopeptide repeat protein [Verrucomicrobiota bacterium]
MRSNSTSARRPLLAATKRVLWLVALPLCTTASTLQEQLDQAVGAFTNGDYVTAYWQFESIELDYGTEPEFIDREFQRTILPVRGYAALLADRPTDALIYLTDLLVNYSPRPGLKAFALYNAAIAQSQAGGTAAAAQTFRTFRQTFPNSNEAALALLQEADLLYQIEEIEQANALLDDFFVSSAPETLRMQGRLRALQMAGESGDTERARKLLFETNWQVEGMPDIAVLSFAALDAGDLFLSQNDPANAIRAYRLTLPHPILIEKQRERLYATEAAYNNQAPFASSIWKSHSRQLIARLARQLESLERMADYTPGLFLRSGQAYLLAARYREAIILFREVALNPDFEKETQAEAHYRWIIAICEAAKWAQAREVAGEFLERHPEHELANAALFLIARAYQGEGQYLEAISVLDQLIENYPGDKQMPRWYFTRGYNYSVLEQQAKAREDFETGLERFPQSALVEQTRLWQGLTYFFERNYDRSLELLDGLKAETAAHPLYPEINYRIANVHYAKRDYPAALAQADFLIKNYPDHNRVPAAQALRGDIYMGLGELTQAAAAFRQVSPDDAQLYDYSTFQASKIYRALEEYELLRKHLQAYVDRDDARERPRVSEALYWIGWSLQEEDRTTEAFPIFEEALTRFGNDPEARAVGSILSAYAQLYEKFYLAGTGSALIKFDTWLRNAAESSLNENKLTWYARLTLFTAQRERKAIDDATADATLLAIHRIVPIEEQDPESLSSVGLVLAARGYDSADDYFEAILTRYPKRFERAVAYYGKAKLAAESDRLNEATRWLRRFLEETTTHPLAPEVRLLAADVLTRQGLYDGAKLTLTEILELKEMRGRPHARALAGLAKIETELGNTKPAIAYWQRIYTLYRAYPELVATAYWESALLFEALGDAVAARNTVQEMLRDERLADFESYALAQAKLPALEAAAQEQSELANTEKIEAEVAQ